MQLQLNITSSERAALQADVSTLRQRLSELAEVQQQFMELQKHDACVSARVSVLEEEHAVSDQWRVCIRSAGQSHLEHRSVWMDFNRSHSMAHAVPRWPWDTLV